MGGYKALRCSNCIFLILFIKHPKGCSKFLCGPVSKWVGGNETFYKAPICAQMTRSTKCIRAQRALGVPGLKAPQTPSIPQKVYVVHLHYLLAPRGALTVIVGWSTTRQPSPSQNRTEQNIQRTLREHSGSTQRTSFREH